MQQDVRVCYVNASVHYSLTDSLDLIIMNAYIPGQPHSQLKGIDLLLQLESFGSGDTAGMIIIYV